MGEHTKISWTQATWNPWIGCRKISQGCANCYMYTAQKRYGNDPTIIRRTSPSTFNSPLKWRDKRLVFTCSWSDFFISEADQWRSDAWEIIRNTRHIYQILTKRPMAAHTRVPSDWGDGWANVWLGVTVENAEARGRFFDLLNMPAKLRFLSVEPMLGPVDISIYTDLPDWVICGGESGPGARPMNIQWARDLRNQCAKYGIPFFFKQVGGRGLDHGGDLLDGLEHKEFPATYDVLMKSLQQEV